MVELIRMPYAVASYKTYRKPANDNSGSVSLDEALLSNNHEGYIQHRFYHMADAMNCSGLDTFQISQGLLIAALDIAKLNGVIGEYLEFQKEWTTRYQR